jgi:hypothetical protein
MAIVLKVKWVDQADHADPYQRIRHVGGVTRDLLWRHTQTQAIQSIEQGLFDYYVTQDAKALKLEVGLAHDGCKYLKTHADGDLPQVLLNLPGCPSNLGEHPILTNTVRSS